MPTIKVCAASDLHGHLPEVPACDLFLLGGDYAHEGMRNYAGESAFFTDMMAPWLEGVPATEVVGVSGNHDFLFQDCPALLPRMRWRYLQDSATEVFGLKVWGTPWQPWFGGWAFNAREPFLTRAWSLIPDDTDVLVLHGPPFGYGDAVPGRTGPLGSPSLLARIREVAPRLVVYGHIHSGRGAYRLETPKGEVLLANVAVTDEDYRLAHPVFETVLEVP